MEWYHQAKIIEKSLKKLEQRIDEKISLYSTPEKEEISDALPENKKLEMIQERLDSLQTRLDQDMERLEKIELALKKSEETLSTIGLTLDKLEIEAKQISAETFVVGDAIEELSERYQRQNLKSRKRINLPIQIP